jgi:small membrane protein
MNVAAALLLALVLGLLFYDWATLRKRGRRILVVEALVFVGGAFFIVFPDVATAAAHRVGIGRGVDFILYPLVIWLVRESLLNRQRRWEESERLTQLVRAQAIAQAVTVEDQGSQGESPQSSARSASFSE